ncbi:hypothetical protein [Microbulbifer spongiae]|uniref:ABC transmembrane type-1 domain-containing protein n=1 Tax=Microbulbifer spongiae TaxID=2944933 RepID=A0ABY9EGQ3_9GAMM|nr:hypothetical protein [Microbulbifer sp. MI-G]WKD51457.1 hypothetical protein M8T91_08585 [Microbulbifer sp. MI-G]
MIADVLSVLRWCISLASKFGRVVFWRTALIVFLTLISQVSTLLASFLPLKVVILLGSERMPSYLPEWLAAYGREPLIIGLSITTIGFFLIHMLSERLIVVVTTQGARRILAKNYKMVLFENQEEIAANAYLRLSDALASVVFSGFALLGIFILYKDMALLVIAYFIVAILMFLSVVRSNLFLREYLEGKFQKIITFASGIGFFCVFFYLVADFIFFEPPSVFVAIVSLLLSRQLLNRVAAFIRDVNALNILRVKIDALFFHNKVLLSNQSKKRKSIWPLFGPDIRKSWVNTIFKEIVQGWYGIDQIRWHPSSVNNLGLLRVSGEKKSENYLIKLYDRNRKSLALHELDLLRDPPDGLLAPQLIGVTTLDDFPCQVYKFQEEFLLCSLKDARAAVAEIKKQLLTVEPPKILIQRYQRSKAHIWQRLCEQKIWQLNIATCTAEQEQQVAKLMKQWPNLKKYLAVLPLAFVNPNMQAQNIMTIPESNTFLLINWSRWSLEPIGVGFEIDRIGLDQLERSLLAASVIRPSLSDVDLKAVELSALVAVLEQHCIRQQFLEGLKIVCRILNCLEILEQKTTNKEVAIESCKLVN